MIRGDGGQAFVLVALMFGLLASAAGLSIDVGAAVQAQRALRNAADAAALLGARQVLKQSFASLQRDITDVAERNGVPDPDGTAFDGVNANVSWNYVDNTGATVSQNAATGVHVRVTRSVPTHFMTVVGIGAVQVSAEATASVETLTGLGGAPPFAVYDIQLSGTLPLLTYDGSGNVTGLNPAAVGQTFTIHTPHGPDAPPGGCLGGNSWKGLVDTSAPGPFTVGGSVPLINGSRAGPTNQAVQALGTSYVFLPLFDTCPGGNAHVVAFAAFDVQGSGNTHTGTLQPASYIGVGQGSRTWSPGTSGLAVTLKLVQ